MLANTDWLEKAFPSLWTDYWLHTPVRKQRFLHPVPLTPALSLLSSYLCLCFSAFVLYPPETGPSHTYASRFPQQAGSLLMQFWDVVVLEGFAPGTRIVSLLSLLDDL